MKTTFTSLMMTAALLCIAAGSAHAAETMHSETVIQKTGVTYDEAALKARMTQELEAALQARGYDAGTVNGTYDVDTANAVRAYQRDNNMAVTGEASADMLNALGVNTTIANSYRIEQRDTIKYKLADKGSENANIYDDPNADRAATAGFRQRNERFVTRTYTPAGGVTTTTTEDVYYTPSMNR